MTDLKHYYFAYGMNTDPGAMVQRTGNPKSLGRARLQGWRFRFAYHADVVPDPSAYVDGVLWKISDSHLASLDLREGYPTYYDRKTVTVEHGGDLYEAIVYYMQSGEPLAPPAESYLGMLHSGYTAFYVPQDQINRALTEAKGANYKSEDVIKNERSARAWDRYEKYWPAYTDADRHYERYVSDPASRYYLRDTHSFTDKEWMEYENELYSNTNDYYYFKG